ncbi:hypothetical protein CONLIGDRAFT_649867 [Coniochaeta ligniaria NRRL 30616]|uniref:Uncharacterized protein n=1 Tax=Coniochaeta ligniaria NRRL 30616 TaxID=1408157 RepID=A0A1J7I776_9PEZI|nr:hypothetical protein CONLIGDRAFT_649867 [Coniochaeta ligniaria NRRL 30616]
MIKLLLVMGTFSRSVNELRASCLVEVYVDMYKSAERVRPVAKERHSRQRMQRGVPGYGSTVAHNYYISEDSNFRERGLGYGGVGLDYSTGLLAPSFFPEDSTTDILSGWNSRLLFHAHGCSSILIQKPKSSGQP